jgi:hypothetical protein
MEWFKKGRENGKVILWKTTIFSFRN